MAEKQTDSKTAAALPLHEDAGAGVQAHPAPLANAEHGKDPVPAEPIKPGDMHKVGLIAPLPTTTRTVEQVYGKDVETVTMIFPKPVTIVNAAKIKIHFGAGPQEVPVVDADNWYLRANGVLRYNKTTGKGEPLE